MIAPEAGVTLTNINSRLNGDKQETGIRPGLRAGMIVDIGIDDHFSFQPGIFYSMKGSKLDRVVTSGNAVVNTVTTYTSTYRINYLEFPLNAQVRFGDPSKFELFVGAGPYLAFALSGRSTNSTVSTFTVGNNSGTTIDQDDRDLTFGTSLLNDVKPIDFGGQLNIGVILPVNVFFRAAYSHGFVNILPSGDGDNYYRNYGFSFTAGYLLGR